MPHVYYLEVNLKFFTLLFLIIFSQQATALQSLNTGDRCKKSFVYDIYLSFFKMGYLNRTINWEKQQGTVATKSRVDVFGIGTTYQQLTHFSWSEGQQSFLTHDYKQTMTGFKSRTILANFFEDGTKTTVVLNKEKTGFDNKGKRLFDLDTLGSQIRLNVMNNIQQFTLSRQASDEIQTYQFKIVGTKNLKTKLWGEIETIRVSQTSNNEEIVLWFAPSLDFQMVKVENSGLMNSSARLVKMVVDCD